jgi:hypothetical protein
MNYIRQDIGSWTLFSSCEAMGYILQYSSKDFLINQGI